MPMALYFVGSFLAVGMLIGDGIVTEIIETIKDDDLRAFEKIQIIFISFIIMVVAFICSWLSVGYIYMGNKKETSK